MGQVYSKEFLEHQCVIDWKNRSFLQLSQEERKSKCEICQTEFIKQSGVHKYCSEQCKGKACHTPTESQYLLISGNWSKYLNRLRNSRKDRQHLTVENLLELLEKQDYKCAISGIPLTCILSKGTICKTNASIDKINPQNGYVINNIQLVCRALNSWRGNTDLKEFIWWCAQVTKFQRETGGR